MLLSRNTVIVLHTVMTINEMGHNPTIGEVSKITGLSYYKVQKELKNMLACKYVIDFERPHRSNSNKKVWLVAKHVRETVKAWHNGQF